MNLFRSRTNPARRLLAHVRREARQFRVNLPQLSDLAPWRPAPVPVRVRATSPQRYVRRQPVRW
jgi:hypothetical protein